MAAEANNFAPYIVDYPQSRPDNGGASLWCCVDDNPVDPNSIAEKVRDHQLPAELIASERFPLVYNQIGGGMLTVSLTATTLLSMEGLVRTKSSLSDVAHSSQEVLESRGIFAVLHENCANEAAAAFLVGRLAALDCSGVSGGGLFNRAVSLAGEDVVTESLFAETTRALQEYNIAGRMWRSDVSPRHPDAAPQWVPRLGLVPGEHVAKNLLVNNRQGMAFNVAAARADGMAAFCISNGNLPGLFEPLINAGLAGEVCGGVDKALGVTAIFHAVLWEHLDSVAAEPLQLVSVE